MSKQELINLKKRLLLSRKYYLVDLFSTRDGRVEVDQFDNYTTLGDNIKIYDEEEDKKAVKYFEKSCERLIRLLADKGISYDELEIEVTPLFYLNESVLKLLDSNSSVAQDEITENDVINDKAKILFFYNVKENGTSVKLPSSVLEYLETITSPMFLVDYNTFTESLYDDGYEISEVSFKKALEARKKGKIIKYNIEFKEEKKYKKTND